MRSVKCFQEHAKLFFDGIRRDLFGWSVNFCHDIVTCYDSCFYVGMHICPAVIHTFYTSPIVTHICPIMACQWNQAQEHSLPF